MRAGYKIVFLCSFRGQAHADAHEKLLTEAGVAYPLLSKNSHISAQSKSQHVHAHRPAVNVLQLLSTTSLTTVSELILPSNSTHPRGPPMSFAQVTRATVHTKPTQGAQVTRAQTWV